MIKLVVEAKEPVYAELGGQPTGYQVMFGPDRDADNSGWTPQGARPAASASIIMSPEAAESYNVGDAFYLPGKGEVVDLDENPELRAAGGKGGEPDGQDGGDTPFGEAPHPDTAEADQKVQAAVPGGEPVPFGDDGRIDGGAITETGTDAPAEAKTRKR